ncbi:50S ribosomal protein L28 [Candidatus Woesebacteria bacterium]|nr:50S ribosomal protein L28 [Candidatus Woesebacteria bacterium]
MAVCQICGKKRVVGRSQKHKRGVAGKRWKKRAQSTPRTFEPNIQSKRVTINGEEQKMKLCTKCIKAIKNKGKVKDFKNISVV